MKAAAFAYARATSIGNALELLEAHGAKAVAEAAQKARALEEQGKLEDAESWRRIESALQLMIGPHQS